MMKEDVKKEAIEEIYKSVEDLIEDTILEANTLPKNTFTYSQLTNHS